MPSSRNVTEVHIAKLETNFEYLQAELERVNSNLDKINKVIFTGNGSPPLPQQIMGIKGDVENIEETVHEKFQNLDTNMHLKFKNLNDNLDAKITLLSQDLAQKIEAKNLQLQGSTKVKVALITAIASIIVAISSHFI